MILQQWAQLDLCLLHLHQQQQLQILAKQQQHLGPQGQISPMASAMEALALLTRGALLLVQVCRLYPHYLLDLVSMTLRSAATARYRYA